MEDEVVIRGRPGWKLLLGAAALLALLVLTLSVALPAAGLNAAPAKSRYTAQIRRVRWLEPTLFSVDYLLTRNDGETFAPVQTPDVQVEYASGQPIPRPLRTGLLTSGTHTRFGPISADGKGCDMGNQVRLSQPASSPLALRLRIVEYRQPAWWRRFFPGYQPGVPEPSRPVAAEGGEFTLPASPARRS